MEGKETREGPLKRTRLDWLLVGGATAIFVAFGALAVVPHMALNWIWLAGLSGAMLVALVACGVMIWRTTGFS
jgi:hypothetical protein